jgi:spore maturation protein CgeB
VDNSQHSLINKIFEPEKEILTYENIEECVHQIKRLINDDDLRCTIALAGYKRAIKEYSYNKTIENLINFFQIHIK